MKVRLTDKQWQKILPFYKLVQILISDDRMSADNFLKPLCGLREAARNSVLLPADYGNWNTIYKRFARWSAADVFEKLFDFCASDKDLEHLLIDSTIVHTRFGSRRAIKTRGVCLGRSRDGFSTKIHLAANALGNAVRFILTGGKLTV